MDKSVHVAITRKIKPGCEEAIRFFFAESLKNKDSLGAQLLRSVPGGDTDAYGILRSFADENARDAFYRSRRFMQWQEAGKFLVEEEYYRRHLHGLEAFFYDPALMDNPPRWKMAVLAWLGVWPTVLVVSYRDSNRLSGLPFWLHNGVSNILVVAALTWAVMPAFTRFARPWLK